MVTLTDSGPQSSRIRRCGEATVHLIRPLFCRAANITRPPPLRTSSNPQPAHKISIFSPSSSLQTPVCPRQRGSANLEHDHVDRCVIPRTPPEKVAGRSGKGKARKSGLTLAGWPGDRLYQNASNRIRRSLPCALYQPSFCCSS